MKTDDIESTAKAWIAMHLAQPDSGAYKENFWAYEKLGELCLSDYKTCWLVINFIRKLNSSDSILSNLAAGPVEDLLVNHGAEIIEYLEADSDKDQQLKKLLAAVWKNDMDDDVWNRISRIAGKTW